MHCAFSALSRATLFPSHPRSWTPSRTRPFQSNRRILYASKSSGNQEAELARLRKENKDLRRKLKELKSSLSLPEEVAKKQRIPAKPKSGIRWGSPNESPPFWTRPPRLEDANFETSQLQNGVIELKDELDQKSLYVMHITAEMAPLAKVGGLADVVTGLARSSISRGHNVEVCLPYYACLPDDSIQSLEKECDFDCPKGVLWDGKMQIGTLKTHVWKGKIAGVQVFLFRPDWSASSIFKADRIYGGNYNETEAYLYFSRACLEFLRVTNRQPNVIHLHEWQTAAVALLYWEKYHHDALALPRIVFTIHNMDSSGECRQDEFGATGISGEVFASIDKALDERTIGHNPERLSLLKGALIYSNAVTTVSPTYAKEVLDGGAGGWFRGTLGRSEIRSKVHGILNGIDIDEWNPERDPYLPMSFSRSSPLGKQTCKEYLQKGLGLEVTEKPLVSCVTRLVPQKGIHLIRHGVHLTNELGGQFVLLGTGHADVEFRAMAEHEFKDHSNVKLLLLYSESLAHLIYAASDIVLVPSMFEPCGLTQMIAMRYGALPLVRRTGGLADTVLDIDDQPDGNGFSFEGVDDGSLTACLTRALDLYGDDPDKWTEISTRNMELDFSWDASVKAYLDIYYTISAY